MSAKKRNYRKKPVEEEEERDVVEEKKGENIQRLEGEGNNGDGGERRGGERDEENDISESLDALLELQKLRRRTAGIDSEKLSKGDKPKKQKKATEDPWRLTTGGLVDLDAVRAARDDEGEKNSSLKLGAFTQQTNALDVDKHMMAFIETEIKKRHGGKSTDDPEEEEGRKPAAPYDLYEELYQIPEHLRAATKPIEEGSVQLSTQMLTAIPEVDLGIDVRLKNIEATERAKRKMLEEKATYTTKKKPEFEGVGYVAADRFWQGRRVQSDSEYEALQHLGVQDLDGDHYGGGADSRGAATGRGRGRGGGPNDRRNMATDDIVLERFKKRMRR